MNITEEMLNHAGSAIALVLARWLKNDQDRDLETLVRDLAAAGLTRAAPLIAAQALRHRAELIRAELVCCEAYDGSGKYPAHHDLCYWGEAAARIVESAP